jgi:hypothetical protein
MAQVLLEVMQQHLEKRRSLLQMLRMAQAMPPALQQHLKKQRRLQRGLLMPPLVLPTIQQHLENLLIALHWARKQFVRTRQLLHVELKFTARQGYQRLNFSALEQIKVHKVRVIQHKRQLMGKCYKADP